MTEVVKELRLFVAELKTRKDVRVTHASFGRKAAKDDVEAVRKYVDKDLGDLYAEANGIHIEWEFAEPSGGGCLRIPESRWCEYSGDDDHCMNFGEAYEAVLLDEITPEGTTYLVRHKKDKSTRIVFASAAEGEDGVEPASSLAEYLRAAMKNGFVHYWPRCAAGHRYVSYAEQEAAIERFQAAPIAPVKVTKGKRVGFIFFSEGGRGEVLDTHKAPESSATDFPGRDFAKVQFDEGTVGWIPNKFIKSAKSADAYERLRDPKFDFAAASSKDLDKLLDDIARAIGPMAHYSSDMPSNARRATGLLSGRDFADAVAIVANLHVATTKAKMDRAQKRDLEATGDEFNKIDYSRFGFKYDLAGLFEGLYGGLRILAHHKSADAKTPADSLLDEANLKRLTTIKGAEKLVEILKSSKVLSAPKYYSGTPRSGLKLPSPESVFSGSGY